jgi:organic radical activating enzyme
VHYEPKSNTPSADQSRALRGRIVDQQPVEAVHFDIRQPVGDFPQHLHALGDAEQRLLGIVVQDRNDQAAHKPAGPGDEIKMPVASINDIDNLRALLAHRQAGASVWLQPVSQGDEATQLCVQACMENQWRLSIQTHKYAGVR